MGAAEAEKIKVVKAAEASADAAQLQGEGIARERRAFIEGLRDSITTGTKETLTTEKISELLLLQKHKLFSFLTVLALLQMLHPKSAMASRKQAHLDRHACVEMVRNARRFCIP